MEGAKELPAECNIKPLEKGFQCIHKHKFMGTKGSSAVSSSRKEIQGPILYHRGVTSSEPHNDGNPPEPEPAHVWCCQAWDELLRSHQAPGSQQAHVQNIQVGLFFVLNSVFLLPFPLRHLITESHKWAGVSTARVLLQEHNPAASSCCFPEQLTTSRRLWNKIKDPGYFSDTQTKKKSARFSFKQINLNQNNDMKLWEELTKGRRIIIQKVLKSHCCQFHNSSKTAYECFPTTSINTDIFSLLGCITNTTGFNFCCLLRLIQEKKCPQTQISVHWKQSFSCERQAGINCKQEKAELFPIPVSHVALNHCQLSKRSNPPFHLLAYIC